MHVKSITVKIIIVQFFLLCLANVYYTLFYFCERFTRSISYIFIVYNNNLKYCRIFGFLDFLKMLVIVCDGFVKEKSD